MQRRKKGFFIATFLLVAGIVVFFVARSDVKQAETQIAPPMTRVDQTPEKDTYRKSIINEGYDRPTSDVQTVRNLSFKDKGGGISEVSGEIVNNDAVSHTALLFVRFYNDRDEIIGTGAASESDVAPGELRPFSILVTYDVRGYKTFKVVVSDYNN